MNIISCLYTLCLLLFASFNCIFARSIHRPEPQHIASITVRENCDEALKWKSIKETLESSEKMCREKVASGNLTSRFLKCEPLKNKFNPVSFYDNILPANQTILYRNEQGTVQSETLQKLAETLIKELQEGKKSFKHFIVLKKNYFNFKNQSGLLILKYKDYPFVIKVFVEHANTLVQPFSKSFEAGVMFMMGGNMRHLTGFTRIDNLHDAKAAILKDPEYRQYIDFPRKWFLLPTEENWLEIDWHNKSKNTITHIRFPSVYCIVADYIEMDKHKHHKYKSWLNKKTMEIVNYLHYIIDPHEGNFLFEKGTNKIVIIDTEHFPTMIGLKKEMHATNYFSWYVEMGVNFMKNHFFQTKKDLIKSQNG